VEVGPRDVEARLGAIMVHPRVEKAHSGAVKDHPEVMKALRRAMEAHLGAQRLTLQQYSRGSFYSDEVQTSS
jgi:hypothetical protein